jgi:hypothetical protein
MIRGIKETPIMIARIVIPTGSNTPRLLWIASVTGLSMSAVKVNMFVLLSLRKYVFNSFVGTV